MNIQSHCCKLSPALPVLFMLLWLQECSSLVRLRTLHQH